MRRAPTWPRHAIMAPAGVRGRGGRPDPRRGRLQPDRVADPRPRLGRRPPARRLRPRRGPPSRDGGPRAQEGPGRCHPRRALDGEDGQLRDRLRVERLRPVGAGEHPARRGPGVHQHATSPRIPGSATTCSRSRRRPGPRATSTTLLGRKRHIPELAARNPTLPGRRRADGHQHADPGHGRRHRQDRDDPPRRAAAGRLAPGRGRCCRSTTSSSSKSRATRWTVSCRCCARRWSPPCRSTCR